MVKYLPCKHEDLDLIPKILAKKISYVVLVNTNNLSAGEAEIGKSWRLGSWNTRPVRDPASRNKTEGISGSVEERETTAMLRGIKDSTLQGGSLSPGCPSLQTLKKVLETDQTL